ncbi:hypothetical protein WN943_001187 [Citrus x changshan-huyou]
MGEKYLVNIHVHLKPFQCLDNYIQLRLVSNTLISSYPRKKSSTAEIRDHCKMLYNIENHRIEELDNLATIFSDRFRICYVLDQPPEEWDGGVGFISKEMILTHCPAPASDIQILRCEPQLMNKAMAAHLKDLGSECNAASQQRFRVSTL